MKKLFSILSFFWFSFAAFGQTQPYGRIGYDGVQAAPQSPVHWQTGIYYWENGASTNFWISNGIPYLGAIPLTNSASGSGSSSIYATFLTGGGANPSTNIVAVQGVTDTNRTTGSYTKIIGGDYLSTNIATGSFTHADTNGNFVATGSGTFDSSNAKTNTFGGLLTILGNRVQEGSATTATSPGGHAEGNGTTASAGQSHAEGNGTFALASNAHSEGNATTASGANSHAEGFGTLASAPQSHAEGNSTVASGTNSFAGGDSANATSTHSYVWSDGTSTTSPSNNTYSVTATNGIYLKGQIFAPSLANSFVVNVLDYGATNYLSPDTLGQVDPNIANVPSSDIAISNAIYAAGHKVGHPFTWVYFPSGIYHTTNVIDVAYGNVGLLGNGPFHTTQAGSIRVGYSLIWNSNTNSDGIWFSHSELGGNYLNGIEVCGFTNPLASTAAGTLNDGSIANNPLFINEGRVGLHVRGFTQLFCGPFRSDNSAVTGYRIGVVNEANDTLWNLFQFAGNDIQYLNGGGNTNAFANQANFPESCLNLSNYLILIATNGRAIPPDSNGFFPIAASDQTTMINPTFGGRQGSIGLVVDNGEYTIINSAGIAGPRQYAVIWGVPTITIQGGNDEPDKYIGTNWFVNLDNGASLTVHDWEIRGDNSIGGNTNFYGDNMANFSIVNSVHGGMKLKWDAPTIAGLTASFDNLQQLLYGETIGQYYTVKTTTLALKVGNTVGGTYNLTPDSTLGIGTYQNFQGAKTTAFYNGSIGANLNSSPWNSSYGRINMQPSLGEADYFWSIISTNGMNDPSMTNRWTVNLLESDPMSASDMANAVANGLALVQGANIKNYTANQFKSKTNNATWATDTHLAIGVPAGAAIGWVFTLTNTTTGQGNWSNTPAVIIPSTVMSNLSSVNLTITNTTSTNVVNASGSQENGFGITNIFTANSTYPGGVWFSSVMGSLNSFPIIGVDGSQNAQVWAYFNFHNSPTFTVAANFPAYPFIQAAPGSSILAVDTQPKMIPLGVGAGLFLKPSTGSGVAPVLYVTNVIATVTNSIISATNTTPVSYLGVDVNSNVVKTAIISIGGITNADFLAQSAAKVIAVYTTPAGVTNKFEVGGYIDVTAVTVDVAAFQVVFTDENGTSRTVASLSGVAATGFSASPTITIRASPSTTVTIQAALTTGTGSITYDTGGFIRGVY